MNRMILILAFVMASISSFQSKNNKLNVNYAKLKEIEWKQMIKAISWVESRYDDLAYNPTSGALGRYQMKKIYVDDVNRILKLRKSKKRYSYKDRTNNKKCIEMFEIFQSHYNPKRNIDKAIRLHRGKNSKPYSIAVKKKMIELRGLESC